jgi:hypothetical protein
MSRDESYKVQVTVASVDGSSLKPLSGWLGRIPAQARPATVAALPSQSPSLRGSKSEPSLRAVTVIKAQQSLHSSKARSGLLPPPRPKVDAEPNRHA